MNAKVLHVLPSMDPRQGGVCQAVRTLSSGLLQEGVSNEVVCMDEAGASFFGDEQCPVHTLGQGKGPWCYNSGLLPWLLENLGRFDIVIVHGLWQYPGYAVRKAVSLIREKSVDIVCPKFFVMPHGMLDPYFQSAKGRRLKAIRNNIYWRLIESGNVNGADGLLFTCEEERRLARIPFRPYKPQSESVVGLGVDAPPGYDYQQQVAFKKRCPELSDEPFLLFLSRVHEKKGVDLLIRAYSELLHESRSLKSQLVLVDEEDEPSNDHQTDIFPRLVIAGPGLDTEYGRTQLKIVECDPLLRDRVIFPGMLSGDAKWGAFYGCQAFILPSHQENFGIAIVEALGCGKPVLISNKVNIWREIEQSGASVTGNDNLEGVKEMLRQWLRSSFSQKASFSAKAVVCFQENYSVKAAASTILKTITANDRS